MSSASTRSYAATRPSVQGDAAPPASARERFLESLLDSVTDYAVVSLDLGGLVTSWNQGARRLLGWTEAEMLGRSGTALFTPEDNKAGVLATEMQRALRGEPAVDERWMQRNGAVRFFAHGSLMALRDPDGVALGFVKVLRDRTHEHLATERRLADAEFLASILASSGDSIKVLDLDARIVFINESGQRAMEIDDFATVQGRPWPELWEADDRPLALDAVTAAQAGGAAKFQGAAQTMTGTLKCWDVQVTPIRGPGGAPAKLLVVSRDITELKQAERLLALSKERLNLALGASGMIGIWDWDVANDVVYADANSARLYQVDPAWAAAGAPLREYTRHIHADDLPDLYATLERALAGAEDVASEYRVVQPDGSAQWLVARGRLVRDAGGAPVRLPGASVDITDRKLAEERQRLLMQELAHRVKNTLAVVQAVASQTLRGDRSLADARQAFTARLLALAQAHDVLLQGSWSEADLRCLVHGAVRLLGHDDPGRFRIAGDDVTLGPRAALSFALALHELGTNAAKYGALSSPDGHVEATWRHDDMAGEPSLQFRWQEVGGPPVAPPQRQGFGSRLIERSLAQGLGATVRLEYLRDGVTFTMTAPLGALQQR